MWDWGPSCRDGAAGRGWAGWNEEQGEKERSVGCCSSDLARSGSLMAYSGERLMSSISSFLCLSLCVIAFSDRANDRLGVMLADS